MRLSQPTDDLILEELRDNGQNLVANVADAIDRHKKHVGTRLRQLEDYGLVENIGRGVYRITEKGKEHLDETPDAHKQ